MFHLLQGSTYKHIIHVSLQCSIWIHDLHDSNNILADRYDDELISMDDKYKNRHTSARIMKDDKCN